MDRQGNKYKNSPNWPSDLEMKTHITQQGEEKKNPTLYHSLIRDISRFFQVLRSKNNYPKPY